MPRYRNHIIMVKLPTSKRFTLSDSRRFYGKHKRARKNSLPNNATIKRR